MHELSLAQEILGIVDGAARHDPFRRVRTLRLSVPVLACVEVDALRLALDALAPGTRLDGATVVVDEPRGRARCPACGGDVEIAARGEPCPCCGGLRLDVTGDTTMRVVELEVE